ncbi:MAG: S8 family serine peptidase, partial [Caldilineaceae bacterium]|nr:S8 family serine peptidase [Caldilineaceae bacterium]
QEDETFTATRVRNDTHELSEVVVRLATDVVSATVAARYDLTAAKTLLASGNIYLFTTDEDEEETIARRLAADPDILWAELNFTGGIPERYGYKTWRWGGEDPEGYVNQNAFHQVNLEPALAVIQGNDVVIAILDTGVALTHPALVDRLLPGYDMVDDDTVPNDDGDGLGWGHGTHIAGIVAQMSPQSKLLPLRVLDTNGRGNTFTLAYAIEWAVAHGADVINLSLGAETNSQVLRNAIDRATAAGVIVVAAAGNLHTDVPQFPASYPGVLSVTAVDGKNMKADFAAFGRDWVDLAAPGVGITSTIVGPHGIGYASWSGTSMATGFVSGAAALLRQQRPTASIALIERQFIQTARNVDAQNPDYAGKLGGLLNVAAALELDPTEAQLTPTPTATPTPTPIPTLTELPAVTPSQTPAPTQTPLTQPTATATVSQTTPTPVVTPTPTVPITTSLPDSPELQHKLFLPLLQR